MTTDQSRRYYAARLQVRTDRPHIMARCKFHDDKTASLSISLDSGLWYCHACCVGGSPVEFEMRLNTLSRLEARKAVNELLGITDYDYSRDPEAIYYYHDELGRPLFRKLRFYGKKFAIERRENDQWISELGNTRRVLYNLPKVLTSNHIFVCEGEKDANRIESISDALAGLDPSGFSKCVATCNFDGAGKWLADYSRYFAGKQVAILCDNDAPGLAHGQMVAQSVAAYSAAVKLVTLPNLHEHGDVSDFLDRFTPQDLLTVIRATPLFSKAKREVLISAEEFDRLYSPDIDWLVQDIIQRGANGFVAASKGAGKSWLVEDLVIALACGGYWLSRKCARCRVALISREDTPGLTRWRLRRLAQGRGLSMDQLKGNLYINTREQTSAFAIDDPATASEMSQALKAFHADLAIFDVFNVMHHADENDNTEMRRILEGLSAIQAEAGCAIGVAHHFNKLKEGRLIDRLRGASAIAGWAEWIVGLEVDQQTKNRKVTFEVKAASSPEDMWTRIYTEGESAYVNEVTMADHQPQSKAGRVLQ